MSEIAYQIIITILATALIVVVTLGRSHYRAKLGTAKRFSNYWEEIARDFMAENFKLQNRIFKMDSKITADAAPFNSAIEKCAALAAKRGGGA